MKVFFANIPYDLHINLEKYYHALFYTVFTLIGLSIEAEVHTNQGRRVYRKREPAALCTPEVSTRTCEGRATGTFSNINTTINCVMHTSDTIYIIEFKLNGTKEEALQQIHDNDYPKKYQRSDKQIVLLGVEFDQKTRNIGDFLRG